MTTFSTGIGIALLAACIGIGCLNGETPPFFPPSGLVTGSFNGSHLKSKFLAFTRVERSADPPS
jgi:hypothetical protein